MHKEETEKWKSGQMTGEYVSEIKERSGLFPMENVGDYHLENLTYRTLKLLTTLAHQHRYLTDDNISTMKRYLVISYSDDIPEEGVLDIIGHIMCDNFYYMGQKINGITTGHGTIDESNDKVYLPFTEQYINRAVRYLNSK